MRSVIFILFLSIFTSLQPLHARNKGRPPHYKRHKQEQPSSQVHLEEKKEVLEKETLQPKSNPQPIFLKEEVLQPKNEPQTPFSKEKKKATAEEDRQKSLHQFLSLCESHLCAQEHKEKLRQLVRFLDPYLAKELEALGKDLQQIYQNTFKGAKKDHIYLATAGGNCSGKTTLLEDLISKETGYAYIDADRTCLFKMANTYVQDVQNKTRSLKEAYEHWRSASVVLSNVLVMSALESGYNIAHGTTLTANDAILEKHFETIKSNDYSIRLLHITSPDWVRQESLKLRRGAGYYQCNDEDVAIKGESFLKRHPIYQKYADEIRYFYRPSAKERAVEVAAKKPDSLVDIYHHRYWRLVQQLHTPKESLYIELEH